MHLVRALLNPARIRILDAVATGPTTPSVLATALDERPDFVSYHVGVLQTTGFLQLVEAEQGNQEDRCVYELTPLAAPARRFAQAQGALPDSGHPSALALKAILSRGIVRAEANSLDGGKKEDLRCASVVLDQQGLRAVSAAIADVLEEISVAQEESAHRLASQEGDGIAATIAVASFASPQAGETQA